MVRAFFWIIAWLLSQILPLSALATEIHSSNDDLSIILGSERGSACILSAKTVTSGQSCSDSERSEIPRDLLVSGEGSLAAALVRSESSKYVLFYSTQYAARSTLYKAAADLIARDDLADFQRAGADTKVKMSLVNPNTPATLTNYRGIQVVRYEIQIGSVDGTESAQAIMLNFLVVGDTAWHLFRLIATEDQAPFAKADFERSLQGIKLRTPGDGRNRASFIPKAFGIGILIAAVGLFVAYNRSRSRARRGVSKRQHAKAGDSN
jgi:hypothetical protein